MDRNWGKVKVTSGVKQHVISLHGITFALVGDLVVTHTAETVNHKVAPSLLWNIINRLTYFKIGRQLVLRESL